ncbi:MAG: ATP-grasp domain-containing protein [Lachnospiraceae bacterium]|nr:ATP-grasp domain-containing protein [Lachnospiraceae bacterium]
MSFDLVKHIRENDEYTVIWLFNIGVEKFLNGEVFTVKNKGEDVIVNHMEEMNLLIARQGDILILRDEPDPAFLNSIKEVTGELPTILCPSIQDEDKSISEIVLKDSALVERVRELASGRDNVIFVPYGVSYLEEEIAEKLGVELFGASSDIVKAVNNKVFSRRFAIEHSFAVPEGKICKGMDELESAAKEFLDKYGKIIIKEPCGASGKGLWVAETPAKLKSALLIIKRFFKDDLNGEWLVEQWCDKQCDLNFQVCIGADGRVNVFSVKEQKVDGTVYTGSVIPPTFDESITEECIRCGEIIGKDLYKFGYVGVLGIDAMLLSSGALVPIVEINGRFTLSTYLSFINERFGLKNSKIFAFYKRIHISEGDDYSSAKDRLKQEDLWYNGEKDGAFIYTSETIRNKRVGDTGRLFTLCIASDEKGMMDLYNRCNEIMA